MDGTWHRRFLSAHVQRIVDVAVTSYYGPARMHVSRDDGAIVWDDGRTARRRVRRQTPAGARYATCSPFAAAVVGAYIGPEVCGWSPAWGKSIGLAVDGPAAAFARPVEPWRRRVYTFADVAARRVSIPGVVACALSFGHVVVLLDADRLDLTDPRSGAPLRGWCVLAADGTFGDDDHGRWYSGDPMRLERADARAARLADAPDKCRLVRIVGWTDPPPTVYGGGPTLR